MSNYLEKSKNKLITQNKNKDYPNQNNLKSKTEIMFRKKGFLHHYIVEGLKESEIFKSIQTKNDLIKEYEYLNNYNLNP